MIYMVAFSRNISPSLFLLALEERYRFQKGRENKWRKKTELWTICFEDCICILVQIL